MVGYHGGVVLPVLSHDRPIGYLRLSLTRACQMRCVYCRPDFDNNDCANDRLTPGEIEAVVRHLAARHGVTKVRLTGGDPTARGDLAEIITRVAQLPGVREVAMTTNGLTLASRARDYAAAGLRRVNVSLDTLDPRTFARVTGIDGLRRVLDGIDAAIDAGLTPVKLNTVVLRDENFADLPAIVSFAADRGVETRFIELMPMGPLADHWAERYVTAAEMRRVLDPHVRDWRPMEQGADSATRFDVTLRDGRRMRVGFITPMSCNFCAACDRVRITADGSLYPCLMDEPRGNLMPAIRPRFDAERFDALLRHGFAGKRAEHPQQGFAVMTHVGG